MPAIHQDDQTHSESQQESSGNHDSSFFDNYYQHVVQTLKIIIKDVVPIHDAIDSE